MYIRLHVQYPLFFSDFNKTLIFLTDIPKINKKKLMKIRSLGTKTFNAGGPTDRQTDMPKPLVNFRNFANAPKPTGET